MIMLIGGSVTLLVLWLMLRSCKQGGESSDDKTDKRRRKGYSKPAQTANEDEVEMSSMDDIENNF